MKLQVKINDTLFNVDVLDLDSRPMKVAVDGEMIEVWPEEAAPVAVAAPVASAAPVAKPAAPAAPVAKPAPASAGGSGGVTAPIPGVITEIKVKEGDTVKHGQELCTLEAMKMKNAIRANRDGKIGKIYIETGQQVKHGQVMMEFAD